MLTSGSWHDNGRVELQATTFIGRCPRSQLESIARPGGVVYVPPFMPHIEGNASLTEELVWLATPPRITSLALRTRMPSTSRSNAADLRRIAVPAQRPAQRAGLRPLPGLRDGTLAGLSFPKTSWDDPSSGVTALRTANSPREDAEPLPRSVSLQPARASSRRRDSTESAMKTVTWPRASRRTSPATTGRKPSGSATDWWSGSWPPKGPAPSFPSNAGSRPGRSPPGAGRRTAGLVPARSPLCRERPASGSQPARPLVVPPGTFALGQLNANAGPWHQAPDLALDTGLTRGRDRRRVSATPRRQITPPTRPQAVGISPSTSQEMRMVVPGTR
jgi:hypothetical protein